MHTPVLEMDDSTISSQLIQLCSGQFSPKNITNADYSKCKSSSKKPVVDHNLSQHKDLPTTQGVRELLGFKEPTNKLPSKSISGVLSQSSQCDGNNSQLLALCSGKFSSQFTPFSKSKQETSDGMTDDDSSGDDGDDLMMLTNGRHPVANSNYAPIVNMNGLDEGSDDEIPRLSKRRNGKYLKNKEKSIKRYEDSFYDIVG